MLYPRNKVEILEALVEMCCYEAANAFSVDRMLIKNNMLLTGCSEPNPQQAFLDSLKKSCNSLTENYSKEEIYETFANRLGKGNLTSTEKEYVFGDIVSLN